VDVVTRACTKEREDAFAELDEHLVTVARFTRPSALREVVERITDAIDGDGGASEDEARWKRRRMTMSQSLNGMTYGDFVSDPLSGEVQEKALELEMKRDLRANDPRSVPQRRLDAFTNIMRRSLEHGELGTERGVRPHIVVVQGEYGDGITEFGRRLSAVTMDMLRCNSLVTPIAMNGSRCSTWGEHNAIRAMRN